MAGMNAQWTVGRTRRFDQFLAPRLVSWSGSWDLVLFVFAAST
jgi:hypothetical protein